MRRALIVQGGWQGHKPAEVADIQAEVLRKNDFDVTISDTLESFQNLNLTEFHLIVPTWSMGTITKEQLDPLVEAVRGGVGIAGLHGGMCDSFRNATEYQFMTGGQWVAHPGNDGVEYMVNIDGVPDPVTEGITDFMVKSEQYYMHVDPANVVLATTRFGDVVMPVVWKKMWGTGRVFYCSLGHSPEVVRMPQTMTLMERGYLWAARN
jgi:type 1 glutamine amidotransferase